jgi:hypothetical protein
MTDNLLPLNFNTEEAKAEFVKALGQLPSEVDVFLVGGSVRNALFKEFHGSILTQRDYDQVITRGSAEYKKYLSKLGFQEHPYPSRQNEQVVYRKPLFEGEIQENYHDWLVFDMHTVDGTTIEDNIRDNVCFTINACAINGKDVLTKPWQKAVIEVLPGAIQDIQEKRLKVNRNGYKYMPSSFYAMLRFMSVGFSAPTDEEVQLLLKELPRIEHARFDRNIKKVWDYVGGEAKARELVNSLGIHVDVFNEEVVKSKL